MVYGFQEEMRLGFHILEKRTEHLKQEAANMMKKIGLLKAAKRKFLGEGLGACSIEELQWIEQQLERSLSNVRARKIQVFKEQIEQLKEKEKVLLDENAKLTENGRLFEKVKLLLFGINFVWPIVHLDNILKQIEAVANYQGDIYMGKPVRINCQKAIQRMKCSALSSRPLSTSPNQLDGDKITGATNHKSVNLEGSLLVQHL
ncbi:MADS-box transcription factor 29-like [Glycine soja]|uniref:MADS-box transcription factor 29-like n=1 Tax=Glycine soja TaxID=3848 RepID=UPI00103952CA|nr:MADS-box transcription factor 29-like [Glycine soja]